MADVRNIITAASVAIALVAGGWAYYATQHAQPAEEKRKRPAQPARFVRRSGGEHAAPLRFRSRFGGGRSPR